jgi:hypothetical protein
MTSISGSGKWLLRSGVVVWAVGAGFFSGLLRDSIDKPPQGIEEGETASREKTNRGPSASFSGIIDAINAHSRANIAEESKEDYQRAYRERIAIVLLAMTMLAIIFQVIEMKRAYGPISEQARTAEDNRIADHRAWIGVARVAAEPITIGAPISTTFLYGNTGRDPARLSISTHAIPVSPDDWTNGKAAGQIMKWHDGCFAKNENEFDPPTPGSVVKTIYGFSNLVGISIRMVL